MKKIDGLEKNVKGFDDYIGSNSKRLDTLENTSEKMDEIDIAMKRIDDLETNVQRVEITVKRIDGIEKNMKGVVEHMGTNNKRINTLENTTVRIDDLET